MTAPKLCKDCRHAKPFPKPGKLMAWFNTPLLRCFQGYEPEVDPVYGKIVGKPPKCEFQRTAEGSCGLSGLKWEPRE